jgi:hypothetical protein
LRARVSKEEAAPPGAPWFETRRIAVKFTQAAQACPRCAALLTMRSGFRVRRTAAKFTQAAQACLRCAALLTMRSGFRVRRTAAKFTQAAQACLRRAPEWKSFDGIEQTVHSTACRPGNAGVMMLAASAVSGVR